MVVDGVERYVRAWDWLLRSRAAEHDAEFKEAQSKQGAITLGTAAFQLDNGVWLAGELSGFAVPQRVNVEAFSAERWIARQLDRRLRAIGRPPLANREEATSTERAALALKGVEPYHTPELSKSFGVEVAEYLTDKPVEVDATQGLLTYAPSMLEHLAAKYENPNDKRAFRVRAATRATLAAVYDGSDSPWQKSLTAQGNAQSTREETVATTFQYLKDQGINAVPLYPSDEEVITRVGRAEYGALIRAELMEMASDMAAASISPLFPPRNGPLRNLAAETLGGSPEPETSESAHAFAQQLVAEVGMKRGLAALNTVEGAPVMGAQYPEWRAGRGQSI